MTTQTDPRFSLTRGTLTTPDGTKHERVNVYVGRDGRLSLKRGGQPVLTAQGITGWTRLDKDHWQLFTAEPGVTYLVEAISCGCGR